MPFDRFEMDTVSVGEVGQAVVNSAADEQNSTDPLALDNFHTSLNNNTTIFLPTFPQSLVPQITTFSDNFYKYYTDVLTQRRDIGQGLLGSKNATEEKDADMANMFTPEVMS